jgi:hypothetical protein
VAEHVRHRSGLTARRRAIGLGLLLAASCGRGERSEATDTISPRDPAAAVSATAAAVATGPEVDAAAGNACLEGDTLLRRLPGTRLRRMPPVPFDSLWPDTAARSACRLAAVGNGRPAYAAIDSLLAWLAARGWNDRTLISADGPDGTVLGVRRGGVLCRVEGRWDGGDDSDTTYVPSDTLEVHFACTRLVGSDTL